VRFGDAQRIHLVGIGGSGMCGIAEVLINLRYTVSGSDTADTPVTERLRRLGGRIALGHAAANVGDADVVVASTAVRPDNPELVEARRRGIPVIPRAEMLAELMRLKSGIAVAGTHGKTSVTSMVAQVLHLAGLDPTIVVGGRLAILDSSAKLGRGDLMVAEADESDGSFLMLRPRTAVITNIDHEHLDHYGSFAALVDAFVRFANAVPFYGHVVVCLDDPVLREALPRLTRRVVTYGLTPEADLAADALVLAGFSSRFEVVARQGGRLGAISIGCPGRHQVVNALAAVAVGLEYGVSFARIAEALHSFHGADRRFQRRGEAAGILVVDDYGHHPTEILATLAAARTLGRKRIIVVFQPHRYTRVRDLLPRFASAFADADVVLVTDVYAAGEDPIPGIDAAAVTMAITGTGHPEARLVGRLDEVPAAVEAVARPGDLVLTLGAGSVTQAGDRILARLAAGVRV
jgi:UDP-N-acetylmuramate--alanine ligase